MSSKNRLNPKIPLRKGTILETIGTSEVGSNVVAKNKLWESEINALKAKNWSEDITDRAVGKGSAVGSLTGSNRNQESAGETTILLRFFVSALVWLVPRSCDCCVFWRG